MKYLVTGGAGFIGSNFVRGLLNAEWGHSASSVVVLDALTYAGRVENLAPVKDDPRLTFVHGSICDSELVTNLVDRADVVVHFAAESHVDRSINAALAFVETNVGGTVTLMEAVRRRDSVRFLHVSTDEVYGSIPSGSSVEDDLLLPNSPYSASKASSDLIVRSYVQTFGVDAVTTRCSNNYGPYQNPEKLIPRFITNIIRGERVPVYGTGRNVRDWLHVDDHCRGIGLAIQAGKQGELYNIGGGTEIDNITITTMILDLMGVGENWVEYVTDRPGHDFRYSVDWSKARSDLGYSPTKSLTDELPELVKWYCDNEDWWRPFIASVSPLH